MSQNSSSEQFFSCTSSDGEQSRPGPGLGNHQPRPGRQLPADASKQQHQNLDKTDKDSATSSSLPHPQQNMTSDEDATRIARLPVADEAPADSGTGEAAPLIRGTSHRFLSRVRTTRWRWLMLLIFALNMAVGASVSSTLLPSESFLERYYSGHESGWERWVRHLTVYDTVVKALLLLPSAWMLVRYELKFTVVFASCATALGTALRLVGASSEHFAVLIAGQLVTSFSSLMFVSVTFFSEVWFSHRERALSTAVSAIVGPKLGEIVSHVLGPLVLLKSDKLADDCPSEGQCEEYSTDWSYYLLGQALLSCLMFLITVTVFRMAPPSPPSLSRKLEISARSDDIIFCEQLKAFLTSFLEFGRNYFLLFLLPAGIAVGASGSLLNHVLINSTKNSSSIFPPIRSQDVVYMEVAGCLSSIGAALLTAVFVDYTKLFYYLGIIVYGGLALSVTAFAAVFHVMGLNSSIHVTGLYVTVCLVGAGVAAFQVLGLEYSVEMTFPIPEGTSAAVFYFTGTILSLVMRVLMNELSPYKLYIVVWVIAGLTITGFMLLILVRPDQKRRMIEQKNRPTGHCPKPCLL